MQNNNRALSLIVIGTLAAVGYPADVSASDATAIAIGTTDLLENVRPTVGHAYDGRTEVMLGYGWNGFDDVSGVWFVPEQAQGALNQLFMHCPFRGGTGVAFADFAIELPRTSCVRLAFEIALRPNATGSDGATYRVKVDGKTLFNEHCTWKEFRPFEVDLTRYAGKKHVSLRLEVDPGPKREPREDWSLWRNVRLLAGTDRELAESQALLEASLARRREEAVGRGSELAEENYPELLAALAA